MMAKVREMLTGLRDFITTNSDPQELDLAYAVAKNSSSLELQVIDLKVKNEKLITQNKNLEKEIERLERETHVWMTGI